MPLLCLLCNSVVSLLYLLCISVVPFMYICCTSSVPLLHICFTSVVTAQPINTKHEFSDFLVFIRHANLYGIKWNHMSEHHEESPWNPDLQSGPIWRFSPSQVSRSYTLHGSILLNDTTVPLRHHHHDTITKTPSPWHHHHDIITMTPSPSTRKRWPWKYWPHHVC